jgi:photosystem II stability/assembly factor-like uncharacterized protein
LFKTTDGGQNWTAVNPGFTVDALAIDPVNAGTLYAGASGKGVFKSTDGGQNWAAANVGLTGKAWPDGELVTALAIDYRNSGTVYAGTYGDGVFKTNNGGETWTAVNTGFSSLYPYSLVIDPQDASVLYAGISVGQDTGVWRTANGGDSWDRVAGIGLPQSYDVASLVVDPNAPGTIYMVGQVGSNNAIGIYRSSDGGDSWTSLGGVSGQYPYPPLAIDPQDSSTMYAGSAGAGIYKSADGGSTWIQSSRGLSAIGITGLTVDHANAGTVYASAYSGLFKSTDRGNTWARQIPNGPLGAVVIDPSNPATIYIVSGANGNVYKSSDGGENWRPLDGVHSIVALAIDPNNPKTLYVGEYHSETPGGPPQGVTGVLRTDDGGETWRPANGGLTTGMFTYGFVAVDPRNSATVYAATLYESQFVGYAVYRSTDGGSNWELVGDKQAMTTMVLDPQHDGVIYAGAKPKGLVKSMDGGASWFSPDNVLKDKSITGLMVDNATAALYAATDDGGVFRSTDAGNSWTQLNSGLAMRGVGPLAVDGATVYAGTPGGVFRLAPHVSELEVDVPRGGAAVAATAGSEESVQVGYATVKMDSGPVVSGVAVFSSRQGGIVVSEAGVPASPPTTRARLFIDYRTGVSGHGDAGTVDVDTGIAIVNYGSETANIIYTLHNVTGTLITSGRGTLAPGAHFARFIDRLKDVASGFNLPPDFPASTGFGSLEISSDQPYSVVALRETINQRDEALATTTPIADLTQPPGTDQTYFPQFVDGGGYTTALVLLNRSSYVERGTLQIFDDSGAPLTVSQVGGTRGSWFRYSIPVGGVFRFQTDGFPASARAGWVLLTPDAGTSTPVGSGVFSYSNGGILVSESGIPAAATTTHARVYVDLSQGHDTGLAIANPASTNAGITIKAYQADGVTAIGTSQGPLQLPSNGHIAKFATELIAGLPAGFTGVLDITSATPFAALTLRSLNNERNDFLMTTFPIADADRTAPSPVVFPHIADGGGFMTEFILLDASGASRTTLSFFDNEGRQLAVGK